MTIGQSTFNQNMGVAFPGMVANNGDYHCSSYICDTAIGFGLGVVVGATTNAKTPTGGSVKLPSAQGDVFRGVTVHKNKEHGYKDSNAAVTYDANEVADIGRKGPFWVQTTGTCTIDTTVYCDTTGKFTSTAGTNTTATTGVFKAIDATLGIAILEINLP